MRPGHSCLVSPRSHRGADPHLENIVTPVRVLTTFTISPVLHPYPPCPTQQYSQHKRSIFPVGDVCGSVPGSRNDVVILEEPEHLTWYHPGKTWTDRFNRVVGIIHTNYLEYIRREKHGGFQAFVVEHVNHWTTKSNCTQVGGGWVGSSVGKSG